MEPVPQVGDATKITDGIGIPILDLGVTQRVSLQSSSSSDLPETRPGSKKTADKPALHSKETEADERQRLVPIPRWAVGLGLPRLRL